MYKYNDKKMTILMFSGEYDKALAALILANSAKSLGVEVTIFFAFWGLTVIRNPNSISEEDKTLYEKMFASMTPKSVSDLPLSKMNFAGIGKKMLLDMMDENETPKIEDFLRGALKKGINMKACKLSCEVMGFNEEDLIEEATIVDADNYLIDSLESDIQLFI